MPDTDELKSLLQSLQSGQLSVDAVLARLRNPAPDSMHPSGDLCIDTGRSHRCGLPEVVYAPGKTSRSVVTAFQLLLDAGQPCLATRVEPDQAQALLEEFPDARTNSMARTVRLDRREETSRTSQPAFGRVFVVSAGTSDRPVAEEALETLLWADCDAELILDVGVAGPQRLLQHVDRLRTAAAIVVVAGMEGALPSVVAGHVPCPVFAVPTSVGYGAAFGGLAALLTMLNSCAANVAVVNIDAGFKGAYLAALIARRTETGPRD